MRKFAPIIPFFLLIATCSPLFAQKRVELGAFVDYLNISQTSTNNFGPGGRVGYCIHRNVMMEGELAYDFRITFGPIVRF
jgi:hypothetical protein